MSYLPECENPAARKRIELHNKIVDKQWDLKDLLPFAQAHPIAGQSPERIAKAVQSYVRSLGRITDCCRICGSLEVTLWAHYAGKFCKEHFDEGMKREEGLDKITCSHCGGTFKHDQLEHGICGSCSYEFNNG